MSLGALREAVAAGRLRDVDLHLASTLVELAGGDSPELRLAAALVSHHTGQGHVCLDLASIAGKPVFPGGEPALAAPPLDAWRAALRQSAVVGAAGEDTPLVLDARDRLYLGRYWYFENTIARRLRELAAAPVALNDPARLRQRLAHYFPPGTDGPDLQKSAAATALLNRLTVISGGPGTGKTTTVTRLLALLVEASETPPRIVLAAPTGKAAARLTESIEQARANLDGDLVVRAALALEAGTIHRLLGWLPDHSGFRHHAGNPLHLDVLVVDEASMVDVPLMARLLDALPPPARLILLGDKDQLASVEAGSVLGDLCNRGAIPAPSPGFRKRLAALGADIPEAADTKDIGALADSLVVLTRSYRFGPDSGIGSLARAVNRGDAEAALEVCADPAYPDATWVEAGAGALPALIADRAVAAYAPYRKAQGPAAAVETFARFRFLCALRDGPFGVTDVNSAVERALRRKGLIPAAGELHYAGRPILITRNDYALRLYNGDIGLILEDPEADGRLRAFFPTAEGGLRRVLLSRLPPHETVYATTIHKSQGSEFDACTVILPDTPSPVVTRELVYTGITRARREVELWGSAEQLPGIVARRVERTSGLREALWNRPV